MTTSRADVGTRPDRSDTGFFGQPGVLANLFGVEVWERRRSPRGSSCWP